MRTRYTKETLLAGRLLFQVFEVVEKLFGLLSLGFTCNRRADLVHTFKSNSVLRIFLKGKRRFLLEQQLCAQLSGS